MCGVGLFAALIVWLLWAPTHVTAPYKPEDKWGNLTNEQIIQIVDHCNKSPKPWDC